MDTPLDVTIEDGVARLVLNRPEVHNAFDEALIAALTESLGALAARDDLRALVLSAVGRSFCAGADLGWMERAAAYSEQENRADALKLAALLDRLDRFPRPTVALVQGATMGGGVGLVSACDIAIAGERARFALSEVRLGLVPGVISPYVVAAIGPRQARRLSLLGGRIKPDEALRIGLIHEIVPDDPAELEAAGERVLAELRQGSPAAQGAAKDLVFAVAGKPIDAALREETARRIAAARASEDGREGLAAFLGKREPAWRAEA